MQLAVDEVAVEFAKVLLHLPDHYGSEQFQELQFDALLALCVRSPLPIADFLIKQFYTENYAVAHRILILQVSLPFLYVFSVFTLCFLYLKLYIKLLVLRNAGFECSSYRAESRESRQQWQSCW